MKPRGRATTKARLRAREQRRHLAAEFHALLGGQDDSSPDMAPHVEATPEGDAFVLAAPAPCLDVRLLPADRSKFLGGIHGMTLRASLPMPREGAPTLTLRYAGRLLKGDAFFANGASKKSEHPLADAIHADATLMKLLRLLDMEEMTIRPEGDTLAVAMRPLGGCFVWSLLPPTRYLVPLPKGHAQAMVKVLERLGRILGERLSSTV